jgi:adenosylcobinamide-GDP ribazoletransferase
MSVINGLRAVLSFLTIIPVRSSSIDEMARHAYLFPVVGGLVGLVCGTVGLFAFNLLPDQLAGWAVIGCLGLITGLTHFDSLLDLGDGLMLRGTQERRLQALHDKYHGIGGTFLLLFSIVVTQSLVVSAGGAILTTLIAAEALSKFSMVLLGCLGKPGPEGIGATFIKALSKRKSLYAAACASISLLLSVPLYPLGSAIAFVSVATFTVLIKRFLIRIFGCINGDMMGACGEFARMISLFALIYVVVA